MPWQRWVLNQTEVRQRLSKNACPIFSVAYEVCFLTGAFNLIEQIRLANQQRFGRHTEKLDEVEYGKRCRAVEKERKIALNDARQDMAGSKNPWQG